MVFGDLEVQRITVNKLELTTENLCGSVTHISKKEFNEYRGNGVPENIYEEIVDNQEFSNSILSDSVSLTVNNVELINFDKKLANLYEQALKEYNATKITNKGKKSKKKTQIYSHMFVYEAWIKRSFYELEIYEDFNIDKLGVEISSEILHPKDDSILTFTLTYTNSEGEKREFEFQSDHGPNSDSCTLYDSNGKEFDFEIIEADDDDDDDEETL
jgi:hypothetical protein